MNGTEMYDWLMKRNCYGVRRVQSTSWEKLSDIYYDAKPSSEIRKAINAECRRCGYIPRRILGIHHEAE